MTSKAKFYEVGGRVRDAFLHLESNDIDYAVEADSYEAMREAILGRGGEIFLESPEYLTVRAKVPGIGPADFVLCRKDGSYSDCRHPDKVEPGTLLDDLARRDFTMNAMARDKDGTLYDPHGGVEDMKLDGGTLRCVGDATTRFEEDALRMLRAIRFSVTKYMKLDGDIDKCLKDPRLVHLLYKVSVERTREELNKAFKFDTLGTLLLLDKYPLVREALFVLGNLRLKGTLEK